MKTGRVSVVERIFSSKKRITTAIQVERGHYKTNISLTSPQDQESLTKFWHEACTTRGLTVYCMVLYGMMHGRLRLAGYYDELCRPDVSLGAHCSFLGNLNLRRRNLR